jgi:hypothetical protein
MPERRKKNTAAFSATSFVQKNRVVRSQTKLLIKGYSVRSPCISKGAFEYSAYLSQHISTPAFRTRSSSAWRQFVTDFQQPIARPSLSEKEKQWNRHRLGSQGAKDGKRLALS